MNSLQKTQLPHRARFMTPFATMCLALALIAPPALGFDSGSDGSDGALSVPAGPTVVDLSLAESSPPGTGNGYYDPDLWAIVFNYTTIDIASSGLVTFINHPSGAPVIWLASGDVTINGNATIELSGGNGLSASSTPSSAAIPGPGGFAGGFGGAVAATRFPSGGYGPGGPSIDDDGSSAGSGGSFATQGSIGVFGNNIVLGRTYGNIFNLPLIGGSGASGSWGGTNLFGSGGGAGGGAILIASSGTMTLNGFISARGGSGGFNQNNGQRGGGGAGGAIRLIANTINGTGSLQAQGGSSYTQGGDGRIRIEADTINLTNPGTPAFTSGIPGLVFPPLDAPVLRATMLEAEVVPLDPTGDVEAIDVTISSDQPQELLIEAENVPLGTMIEVRVVPRSRGNSFIVNSTPLAGTFESSTATASITFPAGLSDVQLHASMIGGGAAAPIKHPDDAQLRLARASDTPNTPHYRKVHEIVGVEVGPNPNETTYLTADGRRVTYPSSLFTHAADLKQEREKARLLQKSHENKTPKSIAPTANP